MTIQQISVFLENRSGQLSEITEVLARNNVDLRAIHIAETSDYGVLRLIAANPQEASSILLEKGFIISMTPVTAVAVPDEPGGLAKVLDILAKAGLDIEYMYSVAGRRNGMAYMIFRVADAEHLAEILTDNGIKPVDGEELGIFINQ